MMRTAVTPHAFATAAQALKMSPGILSRGHLFLSDATGSASDATMPTDPETQSRAAVEVAALRHPGALVEIRAIAAA